MNVIRLDEREDEITADDDYEGGKMKTKTKRWWVSWYEPVGEDQDYRPLKWPLAKSIAKYWCSGWTGDMGAATLCAVDDAATEATAKKLIAAQGWKPREWRFCEAKAADWRPGDRFPWDAAAGTG